MKITTSQRKKFRVRNKLKKSASSDRYRLSVSRSSKNISAQIIDDKKQITLVSASSIEKSIKEQKKKQIRTINNSCRTVSKKSTRKKYYEGILW